VRLGCSFMAQSLRNIVFKLGVLTVGTKPRFKMFRFQRFTGTAVLSLFLETRPWA